MWAHTLSQPSFWVLPSLLVAVWLGRLIKPVRRLSRLVRRG